MWKDKYKPTEDCLKPNKSKIKAHVFHFDEVDEWNKIYNYCKKHYTEVPATKSNGLCNKPKYIFKERYTVIPGKQTFELIIVCLEGCYRFVLKNRPDVENTVKGRQACQSIYKQTDKYNVDFSKYQCENGAEVKQEIVSPHIQFLLPERFLGVKLTECHHLDLNSAYASEIVKVYPELKALYEELYNQRKENNGYYKHVLTNSIGCWQSPYCVDYKSRRKANPYQFANLSKIAINGTRATIEELIKKLKKKGCVPILTNTDGIWYKGSIYHDKNEGTGLGQWKNDHINCDLLVKSKGAYQYLENGKCHSVVRGTSNLDLVHERDDWKFGEIMTEDVQVEKYRFTREKGVQKIWVNV